MGRAISRRWHFAALFIVSGCGPPSPDVRSADPIRVVSEPEAPLDDVPRVLRLRVAGFGRAGSSLSLFTGELSSYFLAKVRAGEIPSTLAERRIAGVSWTSEEGDAVFAPSVPLDAGASYTLASLGRGPLANITTSVASGSFAERIWPRSVDASGGSRAVFCSASPIDAPSGSTELEPARISATFAAGTDASGTLASRCFHWDSFGEASDAGEPGVVVPPPAASGVALDPAPLRSGGDTSAASPRACGPSELSLGPGCIAVEDDRATLRSAHQPLLWSLRISGVESSTPLGADESMVFRGLRVSSVVDVTGTTTTVGGVETPLSASFRTLAARPHVVLNEVLANPIGPEPAGEWIELVNDGTEAVDVQGFVLTDAGGDTTLPRGTVAPGEFALLVGHDFDASSATDVRPQAGTLILRVQRVGTDGLSNQGEALVLRDASGVVLSRFPALAAPKAGQSVARRVASAPDDSANSFGATADGGASPGWNNYIGASP
jgi:hypothetical protein